MNSGNTSSALMNQIEELEVEIAFSIQLSNVQIECDWETSTCTYEDRTTIY